MLAPDARQTAKILLDTPSIRPVLGFDRIGSALAGLITASDPRFAIGIFGEWGSGKTTLMGAIKEALLQDPTVVTTQFNAWRYEREPHLLVPLLDTVRVAVVQWSTTQSPDRADRIKSITARIANVVRALSAGLSGEVGIPGAMKIGYDFSKTLGMLGSADEPERPQSLYFAAFSELSSAFNELRENGASRVVVFIDDLDRCLPGNALDVLESIKLFFDLVGFIFVVGLDSSIVQRAVRSRFGHGAPMREPADNEDAQSPGSGFDEIERYYVEKIFQVPYHVPRMLADDLNALLESMYDENDLDQAQLTDFNERVRPYLNFIAVERRVNPREVKRFLNAYTLQTLIRPELDKDAVLALQTLTFRHDWQYFYDAILTDSILFIDALVRYRSGDASAFEDLSPDLAVLPADLAEYLRSDHVTALGRQASLDAYVSSLELTRGTASALREAYQAVGRLRGTLREVRATHASDEGDGERLAALATEVISRLDTLSGNARRSRAAGLASLTEELRAATLELASIRPSADPSDDSLGGRIFAAADSMYELANRLYRELRTLPRVDEWSHTDR